MDPTANPLNSSLFQGAGVGPMGLNPSAGQAAQNQALTAQQQQAAAGMAQLLQKQGQNQQQKFTSPWQVAGQMAQALKGRMMQGGANQQGAALAAQTAPGGAAAPLTPGQSPATPGAAPGGAPPPGGGGWNQPLGAPQGPAAAAAPPQMPPPQMPPPQMPPPQMPPPNLAGAGLDLSDMFG